MNFDISWENNIYSDVKHINKYPYGELVSIFFNSLKLLPQDKLKNRRDIKVLEIGSGTGNNLWFISENGFDTYGIDGSSSACDHAKKLMSNRNVPATIQKAYFDNLPFEDRMFDIVIDREASYCGTINDIKKTWNEVNRVLNVGGVIISFMFSDDNPDYIKIQSGEIKAKRLENRSYTDVKEGTFKDTGVVHFTTYDEIFDIFHFCDIKFINKHIEKTVYDTISNDYNYAEWIIVGVKK